MTEPITGGAEQLEDDSCMSKEATAFVEKIRSDGTHAYELIRDESLDALEITRKKGQEAYAKLRQEGIETLQETRKRGRETYERIRHDGLEALEQTKKKGLETYEHLKKEVQNCREFALCTFAEAAAHLKGNPYIQTGYRKNFSITLCFKSLFRMHNESVNIWTHLLSAMVFCKLAWEAAQLTAGFGWITTSFLIFLISAITLFFFSALYHTVSCHSHEVAERACMLDYAGISGLIVGSGFPILTMAFWDRPGILTTYLVSLVVLGLPGLIGPLFKFFHSHAFTRTRVLLFCGSAASGLIPLVHLDFVAAPFIDVGLTGRVLLMFLFYGTGVILYVTYFPERVWPGKFDFWGSSHQLWHLCVTIACYIHYSTCVQMFHLWKAKVEATI